MGDAGKPFAELFERETGDHLAGLDNRYPTLPRGDDYSGARETIIREAIKRIFNSHIIQARRGSPTAELEEIPPAAARYVVYDGTRNELIVRTPATAKELSERSQAAAGVPSRGDRLRAAVGAGGARWMFDVLCGTSSEVWFDPQGFPRTAGASRPNVVAIRRDQKTPAVPHIPRNPGPKKGVRNAVKEKMMTSLRSGELTPDALSAMKEEAMRATYGASRDTCRKARDEALSEFDRRQIATNDK